MFGSSVMSEWKLCFFHLIYAFEGKPLILEIRCLIKELYCSSDAYQNKINVFICEVGQEATVRKAPCWNRNVNQ